jgi:beta-lysine 5,6-aminomutase beta subunit
LTDTDTHGVKAYGDHLDDGLMQLAFTLPIPNGRSARDTAIRLVRKMGLERPEVVHQQRLNAKFTYFVVYGRCDHRVAIAEGVDGNDEYMTEAEIESFASRHIGRKIISVGASTGSDTHSVGIDAIINMKGFDGHHGLEAYHSFDAINLGSQVPNQVLLGKAIEVGADAILVSQTVTQQDLHLRNLTELVDMVDAEGRRRDFILICGGPQISDELAKELGFDAGFSRGTYPFHVASYLVREVAARIQHKDLQQ